MYYLSSPRARFLKDVERRLGLDEKAKKARIRDGYEADPDPLGENEMHLYSYYAPSLIAGPVYSVSVAQSVPAPGNPPEFTNPDLFNSVPQEFTVSAPRFSIQPSDIHSTYPPQGHADVNNICPHMVFNDPHMPWLRYPLPKLDPSVPDFSRNRIPWFALLVFELPELTLTADEWNSIFELSPPLSSEATSVTVSLSNLTKATAVLKPTLDLTGEDLSTPVAVICPRVSTLQQLVCGYDANFKPDLSSPSDLSRYKYFAHVRKVNTQGMADAGVEDEGLFSVVISHRTGPPRITVPTAVVVHLVSLEGWSGLSLPGTNSYQRAAMISLYSWTYQCLPPLQVNFVDSMRNLGRQSQSVLRPTDNFIKNTIPSHIPRSSISRRIAERLQDGYSLIRYRTQTGEATVAFTRGPFVPVRVPSPLSSAFPLASNFGTDLQILDPETGIMDISYSAAWQLGKTLALADKGFCTALARLRSAIVADSLTEARTQAFVSAGIYSKRAVLLSHDPLSNTIDVLSRLQNPDIRKRWYRETVPPPNVSLTDTKFLSDFRAIIATKTSQTTSSTTEGPYNEFNTPVSDDWATVMTWLLDRMFFGGVPAHYLLTEPSFLPPESLRFFYIDENWVKSLLDGALSLANHIEKDDDSVRAALKTALKNYLKTELTDGVVPQIPKFGFLMRSKVVSAFPSMSVKAPFTDPPPGETKPSDVLRLEVIDTDTMLCLFDRIPDTESTAFSIVFTQPPHQQCFALGYNLTSTELEIEFQKIYTEGTNPWGPFDPMTYYPGGTGQAAIYDWDSKLIIQPAFLKTVIDLLNDKNKMQGVYSDPKLMQYGSASLFGLQLNNPIYQLILSPPQAPTTNPTKGSTAVHTAVSSSPRKLQTEVPKVGDGPKPLEGMTRAAIVSPPASGPRRVGRKAGIRPPPERTPPKRITPQFLSTLRLPPILTYIPPAAGIKLEAGELVAAPKAAVPQTPSDDQLLLLQVFPATTVGVQVLPITNTPVDVVFNITATPANLDYDVQLTALLSFFQYIGDDIPATAGTDAVTCLFSDTSSASFDMLDNKRWLLSYELIDLYPNTHSPPYPNTKILSLYAQPRDMKNNYVMMDKKTEVSILARNVVVNPTPEIASCLFVFDYNTRAKSDPNGPWIPAANPGTIATSVQKVLPNDNNNNSPGTKPTGPK